MTFDPEHIARTFVHARHNNIVVQDYPGNLPETLGQAYQVQDIALALQDKPVAGWKVGKIPDPLAGQFGADRLCGPIFADSIVDAHGQDEPVEMPILTGFAASEAEIMIKIGPSADNITSIDEAMQVIEDVRFGIEVASSPFPGINDHGPVAPISDFGNNYGLLLGPEITDWRTRDILGTEIKLTIDEEIIGTGLPGNMLDGPFGAVVYVAGILKKRGIDIAPGTWISSGALTGVHPIQSGQSSTAYFGDEISVSCRVQDVGQK